MRQVLKMGVLAVKKGGGRAKAAFPRGHDVIKWHTLFRDTTIFLLALLLDSCILYLFQVRCDAQLILG